MSYTSQANIEAFLGRNLTTSEEAYLDLLLALVDTTIDEMLGGSYNPVVTTKYYDGGYRIISIDPCYSITEVSVVDSDANNTVLDSYVLGEDLELQPINDTVKTYLEKRFGRFPIGIGKIGVSATFGLGANPPDSVVYLATYMAGIAISGAAQGGKKRESIEGYSVEFVERVWASDEFILSFKGSFSVDSVLL